MWDPALAGFTSVEIFARERSAVQAERPRRTRRSLRSRRDSITDIGDELRLIPRLDVNRDAVTDDDQAARWNDRQCLPLVSDREERIARDPLGRYRAASDLGFESGPPVSGVESVR